MDFLRFLVTLGITHAFFAIVWSLATKPLLLGIAFIAANFDASIKIMNYIGYLGKSVAYYLIASIISIITLQSMPAAGGVGNAILYQGFGLIFLWTVISASISEAKKEYFSHYSYHPIIYETHDGVFLIGSIVVYLLMLIVPEVAVNPASRAVVKLAQWAVNLPIIGILLTLAGGVWLLVIGFFGVLVTGVFITCLVGWVRRFVDRCL